MPSIIPEIRNSDLLPLQADFLIACATVVGFPAYRNEDTGSWYIDELTKTLYEKCSGERLQNFIEVLVEVQGRVSNLVLKTPGKPKLVQMPEFRCTLRGPIYLCAQRQTLDPANSPCHVQ